MSTYHYINFLSAYVSEAVWFYHHL